MGKSVRPGRMKAKRQIREVRKTKMFKGGRRKRFWDLYGAREIKRFNEGEIKTIRGRGWGWKRAIKQKEVAEIVE